MTAHKHAALMAEYAKDALETEEPWQRWEYRDDKSLDWSSLYSHPVWRVGCEYRRRPRTININGFEVPEPMRERPAQGAQCWVVAFTVEGGAWSFTWSEVPWNQRHLARGLIHLTREAAEIHAKALLSFTEEKTK